MFTLWTIHYTVIPLYQKSLLDEQIAQKELELNRKNKTLENIYKQVRKLSLSQYVMSSGSECTGILLPPNNHTSQKLLEIDIPSCLIKTASEHGALDNLNQIDREVLNKTIAQTSKKITALRGIAIKGIEELKIKAKSHPETLPPPGRYTTSILNILSTSEPPAMLKEQKIKAQIEAETSRITYEYISKSQALILSISHEKWQ
ncbi:hypothetical protein [Chromobacterium vaccinii]|uniref:hypothetical protein n=1 Tax=Chromobacterium vaccinii TaxID=1108595 RepID=UPI001186743D|nr:hypothetical protein [Chromobacterium vaccinii]